MKQKQKYMLRQQAESWGDNVAVCWRYGQSYDVSIWWIPEGRRERPDGGQAKMREETKPKKKKKRPQQGGGFSLNLYLPGVSTWSGATSFRDIYRGIMSRIMRYHKIRYIDILIVSTSRILGTDIEISYPVDIFLDSEHDFLPSQVHKVWCTKMMVKEMVIWRLHFRSSDIYWEICMYAHSTQSADLDAVLRKRIT